MKKKILILNWRDPNSPLEGGAERFTQKYAQYWASSGHHVYWLTNTFPKSKSKEKRNGIEYIRLGPALNGGLFNYLVNYPIYLIRAIITASKMIKQHKIDIVIDEIHGFPLFSPLYSPQRNILLVCEVAGPIWDKMFPYPINWLGKNIEKLIYKIYKNSEIWAISPNTKQNIQHILPQAQVKILPLGIDFDSKTKIDTFKTHKTSYPSAIFLARLVKMKGIESAIRESQKIAAKFPDFKLLVVGEGNQQYEQKLKHLAHNLNIQKNIEFLGHIDGQKKFKLLAQAHFLFHPSHKEGFGLTVIEAGIVGTPAIIRSGSSMDALIKDGHNGYHFHTDSQLSELFIKHFDNSEYQYMCDQSIKEASKHLWSKVLNLSIKTTNISNNSSSQNNKPLVSVIIPTYKPLRTLEKCLQSIKSQTYKNIEIIVVDGIGYSQTEKAKCKKIVNKLGKYLEDGPERSIQRNRGIKEAKGKYVYIIDQDMYLTPQVIEEAVAVIKDHKALLIPEISIGTGYWTKCVALDRYICNYLETSLNECVRFFRKKDAQKIKGYDPTIVGAEDSDFHYRILQNGTFSKIKNFVHHDEGKVRFWDRVNKKYYYSSAFRKYHQRYHHLATKQFFPIKLAYFKHPFILLKNIHITVGMIALRFSEVLAGLIGYIINK